MDVDEILALVNELAQLANNVIAAHKAGNQADFDAAWAAMQTKLGAANTLWDQAGKDSMDNAQGH